MVEVMVVFAVAAVVVTTFLLGVMGDKIENKNKIKPSEKLFS
jgi:hypothetical protein